MFVRSLKVFVGLALLGLAMTLGYAALQIRGPGDKLAEVAALFARGQYLRVVTELDQIEHSVSIQRDPNKRRDLLRWRYRAHQALDNAVPALRDLDRLLADLEAPDEQLRLDHVRLLARNDRGAQALREVRDFLADNPTHARALELAGEACQTVYLPELKAVLAAIDLDLGAAAREEARSTTYSFLYRPDRDPQVEEALAALQRLYQSHPHLTASWPRLSRRLRDLRVQIQTALGYFTQSLELDAQQVAAFRGLALSLGLSHRLLDLQLLCETYRRRFNHEYVLEAGAAAAFALLRENQDEAVLATCARWLPPRSVPERLAAGPIGPAVVDLLVARTVAAWRLGDRRALQEAVEDGNALNKAQPPDKPNPRTQLPIALAAAFSHAMTKDSERAEQTFEWATNLVFFGRTEIDQIDLAPVVLPARIDNLQQRNGADPRIADIYANWARQRPGDIEPLLGLARWHLGNHDAIAAMGTLDNAQKIDRQDERELALRIEVSRILYRESEQDGASLLKQCLGRQTLLPDVPSPIGFILCAEAALDAPCYPIAVECARATNDAFPWAKRGRMLELRAALASGDHGEAARIAEQAWASWPDDPEVLALVLAAREATGESVRPLLWRALATSPPTPHLTALVLHAAAHDEPAAVTPFLAALGKEPPTPELAVLGARALARTGDGKGALARLRALTAADRAEPALRADLAATVAAAVAAEAETVEDRKLRDLLLAAATEFGLDDAAAAPVLIATARELAAKAPATAYEMLTLALASARPADRTGSDYALAGTLALRLGSFLQAESHWTAALAFPDGHAIAEDLARLCFANGRPERAQQVFRLASDFTDAALLLRCGRAAEAQDLVVRTLAGDASNFLAHATIAAAGMPSPFKDLAPADAAERDDLLEVLSLLQEPALCRLALPKLAALTADKSCRWRQLLLAKALAASGQGAAAARIHVALQAQGFDTVEFWREVSEAAAYPGYPLDAGLAKALGLAATRKQLATSPYAMAFATARAAAAMTGAGRRDLALQVLVPVWIAFDAAHPYPPSATPTAKDAEEVLAAGRTLDAWWILDRLRPTLSGAAQDRCVARMLELAERLTADPTTRSQTLYGAVSALTAATGARGAAVHYLRRHAETFPRVAPTAEELTALLHQHLAYAASRPSEDATVGATVDELVQREGHESTLAVVEAALADHPASLSMWLARTRLLAGLRRGSGAVADLRSILRHAVSPSAAIELVTLAAAEFALQPADRKLLEGCPAEQLATPRGSMARGLVQLFGRKPEAAVPLLDQTTCGDEPLRLQALAQALLASTEPDAAARASQALQQLATRYPNSSAARYAGSFALQLAPR